MALIVEDGSIVTGAESYASVAYADSYFAARNVTTWAALSTAVKEANLRKATEFMLQVYRRKWQGLRVSGDQLLDWPRSGVVIDDYITIDTDAIPEEVKRACAELALRANDGALRADLEQGKVTETVGPISVTYDTSSPQYKRYLAIDNMLAPYFGKTASSGICAKVGRT